jgi:hypothetical protein
MNDNIIAGGEIHAGGGYSEGTQEAYEAFVKGRNRSFAKARINALAEQATEVVEVVNPDTGITHHREFFDREKFAELIVKECADVAWMNTPETEELEYSHLIKDKILKHFGVEE